MSRRILSFVLLCVLFILPAFAGDPKVAELLGKLQANSIREGQEISAALVALGPSAIKEVCRMLAPYRPASPEPPKEQPAPAGLSDDAKAQFALNGIAMWVCRPGAEQERKMFAEAVIEFLQTTSDNEVKAFLIRLLQLVGKDEAVGPLSELLGEERLCDPAAKALLAIRTPEAINALLKALPNAHGARRITIVHALGEARAKEAVAQIIKDAESEDANLRRTALYALGNIGDPSATDVLAKATKAASPYDSSLATDCYLLLARRLAEAGNKEACVSICRDLMKTRTAPRDKNVQCAALSVLVAALGKDALDDIMRAVDSTNKEIRAAALMLACTLPGEDVTVKCVEKMKQAQPEVRVEIAMMLARRADKSALPALLEAIKDPESVVRVAAITASATLGGNEAIPSLIRVFESDQAEEIKAAQEALARLPGEEALKAAADALGAVPKSSRFALLQLLAARRAKSQAEAVFAATQDKDNDVRREAIKALGNVCTAEALPRMIDLMLNAKDSGEQSAAMMAIAAVANRISDIEKRAEPLLAALPKATVEQRGLLLRTMGQVGGKKALDTVLADVKSADPATQDAAVRALAEWQDVAAAPELLNIARTSQNKVHQVLALRGYVRITSQSQLPPEQKVKMFAEALSVAQRPDEKRQALAGLSEVKTLEALKLASTYLDEEALRTEAATAAAKIALPKEKRDKGITTPDAGPILKKALEAIKDENLRKRLSEHLATISGTQAR